MTRVAALLATLLVALGAVGCGLGGGASEDASVELRVTESFGDQPVADGRQRSLRRDDTVMRLLQRKADIGSRYGGTFVQSIEGRAGGRQGSRPVDWFYYVNGIESDVGAAEFKLSAGDRVWWDLHDWGAAMRIPAVVGSFPEPFLSGSRGKRIPVRLECVDAAKRECDEVAERLERADVKATSRAALSQRDEGGVLRVLVGRWSDLRLDPTALTLERGPEASGVYVRPAKDGRTLEVLDPRGRVARTIGAGAGLVAATRKGESRPVWLVTGTDEVGLAAAAAALEEGVLGGRFALAIEDGRAVPAPAVDPDAVASPEATG